MPFEQVTDRSECYWVSLELTQNPAHHTRTPLRRLFLQHEAQLRRNIHVIGPKPSGNPVIDRRWEISLQLYLVRPLYNRNLLPTILLTLSVSYLSQHYSSQLDGVRSLFVHVPQSTIMPAEELQRSAIALLNAITKTLTS